jgi:branched-chain amino acid transport system ATP-binding protein
MLEPLLTLRDVYTDIGRYHILHGVDLAVPTGSVTMLLGRNGAGKTTTMRTIMGLWRVAKGEVSFDGKRIDRLDTPAIAALGIGYVPENMGVFTDLTVRENLLLGAAAGPLDPARLDWIFSFFAPLKTFWNLPAGNLSGGQKQMLSVARAIVEPRRLILIDEPSKGLAPAIIRSMISALAELKSSGATILLVEQNFSMAKALGDTVAVMDDGRVVHAGGMAELAADAAMQQRLMGLSLEAHQ